jgi:tripartite ATP-independent transporter DctM subunit
MGLMLESSGVAERLYRALYVNLGGLNGGLAILTVLVGTILAACVGVIGASVSMLAIVALPAMVTRGYSKSLAAGTVCASGTLGILIPPSIMLVIYGPIASLSVGKLFMAAFVPGFMLSFLYMVYIAVRCTLRPKEGPPSPAEDRRGVSAAKRLSELGVSALPPVVIVLAVLGTIFFGVAAPTEAAAVGATATILLALAYRTFNLDVLKKALTGTMRVTGMILLIAILSVAFTSVFLAAGGGGVVTNAILAAPFGRWGAFAAIMILVFILGMFLEWMGVVFVLVPLLGPTVATLQFDPLWFAMMVCVMLQTGFLSPPFATAIFYLRGSAPPELGVTMGDVIRGVYPFIGIVFVVVLLCTIYPQLVLWLPNLMIR